MGSTPHAHAMAKVNCPHEQGVVAMIGVFIDTFVVLTMTALVVISTLYAGNGILASGAAEGVSKTNMAQIAFSSMWSIFSVKRRFRFIPLLPWRSSSSAPAFPMIWHGSFLICSISLWSFRTSLPLWRWADWLRQPPERAAVRPSKNKPTSLCFSKGKRCSLSKGLQRFSMRKDAKTPLRAWRGEGDNVMIRRRRRQELPRRRNPASPLRKSRRYRRNYNPRRNCSYKSHQSH